MLVVLDNARDAAQVRPLLPGTASSAVLVTTRSRMPDLASTKLVDLNVLDDDEALTLFVKVVGEERAAAEPEATAELLVACAGLPLAIRICAARLATRSGWTIRTMASRLRDGTAGWTRCGSATSRSAPASRSASPACRASPTAGHRPGPRVLPARPVAWAVDPSAAAAALFGTRSTWPRTRWRPWWTRTCWIGGRGQVPVPRPAPGLRRRTGRGRLPAAERDAAVTRLLSWYMRTADAAATAVSPHRYNVPLDAAGDDVPPLSFATAEEALAWYDSERVNLVAATRQAAGSGLHEIAWRLPAPLFMIFNSRGNWADCIATHRIALDSARRAGNRQGEAWVLNNLGDALGVTRDPEGIGYLERSLEIRREIGDRMGEAQAANNLADAYQQLGRTDEALDLLWRALDLNREVGYRFGEGIALVNLGSTLLDLTAPGRPSTTAASAARLRRDRLCRRHRLRPAHPGPLLSLARPGHGGLDCLQQALASHQAAGNRRRQAATLRSLGTAQSRVGLAAKARESLDPGGGHLRRNSATASRRQRYGPSRPHPASPDIPVTIMPGRYDAARLPRILPSSGAEETRGSSWGM